MSTSTLMEARPQTLWNRLIATESSTILAILRWTVAIVIFPHGAQKVLGWFGGFGFTGTMGYFESLGIPYVFGLLAIIAEFFGPLALAAGFLSRIASFGIACVMLTAMFMVHVPNGFFMNWGGQQAGEGFEFHLLVIGITIAIMLKGSGSWSVDQKLQKQN